MKTIIMGNSSSGKSTLAIKLVTENNLAHLDLDVLAWLPTDPPERQSLAESHEKIKQFISENKSWVIEGCYADLLALIAAEADELIFMDLPIEQCIANAKNRPWEPHKYESKAAQDANLKMLINWVEEFPIRDDACSLGAHESLFVSFKGIKNRHTKNLDFK